MGLKQLALFAAIGVVAMAVGRWGQQPGWWGEDKVVTIATADPRLVAAKARAIATLDTFLDVALSKRAGTSKHAVKIPLKDGNNTEVFWVNDIQRRADGGFNGRIDNTPTTVQTVKLGQRLDFNRGDIVDWMYVQNGRLVGNYTICVLLDETTEPKLSEIQAKLGVDCAWNKPTT